MSTEPTELPDLALRTNGGTVMAASDEFFADKENLIKPERPEYRPRTFTPKGQEFDGWETKRRFGRQSGHDWVLLRLGVPGVVRAFDVDTAHFLGNYPSTVRIEVTGVEGYPGPEELDEAEWTQLVPESELSGGCSNVFTVDTEIRATHVRLHAIPDGGIARLRVHGEVVPDPRLFAGMPFDLVATHNGGTVRESSGGFFSPASNMLQPGESRFMADGWETARRRDDGHDWAVIGLGCAAVPSIAEIATTHYRGNSPDRIALFGRERPDGEWFPLLAETRPQPDTTHRFWLRGERAVSEVLLENHPDGGIGRFRLYGVPTDAELRGLTARWFNLLPEPQAIAVLEQAGLQAGLDAKAARKRPLHTEDAMLANLLG